MVHHLKVLVTNPLLNVSLGPSEVVISNKHLDYINGDFFLEKNYSEILT